MSFRSAGLAAAMLLVPRASMSADSQRPVRFDYSAEAGCPDEKAWIADTLGRAPAARIAVPEEAGWTLRARIVREGARFVGQLQVVTPDATSDSRRFRGNSCAEVALALAVAAALSVDPEHGGSAPPASTEAMPPPAPPTAPPPPPVTPTARPPEPSPPPVVARRAWSLGLGAALVLVHSAVDSTMPGAEVVARLRSAPGLPVSVRMSVGYAQSRTLEAAPGEARFYLPMASLQGCLAGIEGGTLSLAGCAGARGGILVGSGIGVDLPSDATRGWLAWVVGVRSEVALGRGLRGELGAALAVPQTRYTYIFDGPPVTITAPPPWGWELSLGVLVAP